MHTFPEFGTPSTPATIGLINGRLVLPACVTPDKAIIIRGGHIVEIVDSDRLDADARRIDVLIDVEGRYIAPGFIDIHTHGALGHTFNEASSEAFSAIAEANVKQGVTALLATVATAPIEDMVECLRFTRQWMADNRHPDGGAAILGVHLEGPYFSVAQKGAQDARYIRVPDDGSAQTFLAHADVIKIMSLAPELPGAFPLIEQLHQAGVVPAAGHSSAQDTHVLAAMQHGLCHAIHLWSGQSTTVRDGPWRKPGLLEASLCFPGLTAEMIADNKHLPVTLMRLAYQCLGPDRLCIVSDATSGAGLPEGTRFTMGKMEYVVRDGVGMTLDGTSYAGSTTLLGQMIPVLVNELGLPLAEAMRLATLTPARVIGVDSRIGSLQVGKDADIVILDNTLTVWRTMIGGIWKYVASPV